MRLHMLIVPVFLVCLQGPASLSEEDCVGLVENADRILRRRLHIGLSIAGMASYDDPFLRYQRLRNYELRGKYTIRSTKSIGVHPEAIKIAISGPSFTNRDSWIYGFANGICEREDAVAYIAASRYNMHGDRRYRASYLALVHELGHLFGARHDRRFNSIMNPGLLYNYRKSRFTKFTRQAKRSVKSCTAKW